MVVLIVDDEPQIGEVLSAYLQRESFETVVCGDVSSALASIEKRRPDIMLLDITLPDGSGLDILKQANKTQRIPTIMLTARSEEVDRVIGLELGADDYVVKPFSPREVVARVRAVLRRASKPQGVQTDAEHVLQIKDLQVDTGAHEVRLAGKTVAVTPAEFRILTVLAQNAGQVLTRAQILDLVHDDGSIYERTLDRHINNLRHKIEPNPEEPEYVLTVYGVGYKLRKD
ncbi:MAG TPA: response regulator transcription factor [Candidatus Rubrimentiphilum sp.]|nr:response regulator transcription factor [Candidatus Rubrimentiphilum sp.]